MQRPRPRPTVPTRFVPLALAALLCHVAQAIEVELSGLTIDLERNVRAYLSIDDVDADTGTGSSSTDSTRAAEAAEIAGERRVRRLHAGAPEEITAALQPFGYYEPRIDSSLERSDGAWVARYAIDIGPPILLASVATEVVGEGRDNPVVAAALAAITLSPGHVLNHAAYEAARQSLYDAAYNSGFIDARYVRSELRVRLADRTAVVDLELDTGPRYYFGEIEIEQTILDPAFVERLVSIAPGEPFDTSRLVELQIALNDSGYFNQVIVDAERELALDQHIPVVVRTTPRRRQEYTLGIGYGTDTGARISMGVDLRRIGPHGHHFNTDFRVSKIEQTAAAEYLVPTRNVATDHLAFRTSIGHAEIADWDTRQISLGTAWQDGWHGMRRNLYMTAQREEFATDVTEPQIENVLYAGMQLTRQRADDPLYPRHGYSWSVDLRAGTEAVLDATQFARLQLDGNLVRSLAERLRVLLRAAYGALNADDFDRLIPSQRFYAGGDGSVRGYGYRDLGPQDANGANIGGRYMAVASAELEIMITRNYGAAVFIDAGNAANERWPEPQRGVGIGMRWRSPVGIVGIDIAHPLDDPDTDYRLHLSIGSDL